MKIATKTSDPFCEVRLINKRTSKKEKKKYKTRVIEKVRKFYISLSNRFSV